MKPAKFRGVCGLIFIFPRFPPFESMECWLTAPRSEGRGFPHMQPDFRVVWFQTLFDFIL